MSTPTPEEHNLMTNQTTKQHGNTGNQYAVKEIKKTAHVHFVTEPENKSAWVRQAQIDGDKKLATWIQRILNQHITDK